jgi:hypothetical protein
MKSLKAILSSLQDLKQTHLKLKNLSQKELSSTPRNNFQTLTQWMLQWQKRRREAKIQIQSRSKPPNQNSIHDEQRMNQDGLHYYDILKNAKL